MLDRFFKLFASSKDRGLGVARGKRRYDLPLQSSGGNGFLVLLIALMTFLAVLALVALFALSQITTRWSAGLENEITIEIPAESENGSLRSQSDIKSLSDSIQTELQAFDFIETIDVMDTGAIEGLIAPWLGENFAFDDMPLPGLIAVSVEEGAALDALDAALKAIDPTLRLDTHEDWLASVLSLIGSLQFSVLVVTIVIALTGITAIAGAIKSRMAEHKPDVELLHLMGASDVYIAKQFQRHALVLGFKGGVAGLLLGGLMIGFFALLRGDASDGLLPAFEFAGMHIAALLFLPVMVCGLSAFTARSTVLRALAQMP